MSKGSEKIHSSMKNQW